MSRWRRLVAAVMVAGLATLVLPARALATPGPPSAPEYWFDAWQVPALWDSGARGQGVTIAEIDTGVSVIPQLAGRVLRGTDLSAAGGDGQVDREIDPFGHGTAMASIMVARPGPFGITGLAPGAKILPIAVPLSGTTQAGQPDDLDQAIRYAADRGAKIINMSLGGDESGAGDTSACDSDEQAAVFYALAKGAILTAAVGNSGPTRNEVEDPAVCQGVVAVGATDATGAVASFSTRQPYVTLVAPGVGVPSLGRIAGKAYTGDGTSQATALTSAALALVWSKYPSLTGPQVVARVLATLDHRRSSPSSAAGYGLLDAGAAVRTSVPVSAANPVYSAVQPFVQRYTALRHGLGAAPAPAANRPAQSGGYTVGSISRVTSRVVGGAVASLVGLILLVVAAGLGIRRRRRPPAVVPAGPDSTGPPAQDDLSTSV